MITSNAYFQSDSYIEFNEFNKITPELIVELFEKIEDEQFDDVSKEVFMYMTIILNDICPNILVNYDSLSNALNQKHPTKLIVWFQRYLNLLAETKDLKFFLSKNLLVYVVTSSLLTLLLNIRYSDFEFIHYSLNSKSPIYDILNRRYIYLDNFQNLYLKLSSLTSKTSTIDFGKLVNVLGKCNKFLNDYVRYVEIKNYDITPMVSMSGIITHIANKTLISFAFPTKKEGNNVQSIR